MLSEETSVSIVLDVLLLHRFPNNKKIIKFLIDSICRDLLRLLSIKSIHYKTQSKSKSSDHKQSKTNDF